MQAFCNLVYRSQLAIELDNQDFLIKKYKKSPLLTINLTISLEKF